MSARIVGLYREALAMVGSMKRRGMVVGPSLLCACVLNPAFDPDATVDEGVADTTAGSDAGGETQTMPEPGVPLPDPCPWLPAPMGNVITVAPSQASELSAIVQSAPADSTIVLEPGMYSIEDALYFTAPGITLRSSTGNPTDVVIDGQRLTTTVVFIQQPRTTIAEITLQRPEQHLVHISGANGIAADQVQAYRVRLLDPGFAAFKVNPTAEGDAADDGTFACSSVELTDAGREELGEACADISGILGIASFGWTVRDSEFSGLWCEVGQAGAAIRFIETSAHSVVERNIVRDSFAGIIFGIWDEETPRRDYGEAPCGDGYFDHLGGVIANNMVIASGTGIAASSEGFDTGIGLWNVCDATVVHNTVVSAVETFNSIEYRFPRTQARVVNNLVTNEILDRDDAGVPVAGNAIVDLTEFVDPLGGDVHLVDGSTAIDAGVQLGEDTELHDLDGDPRDDRPDVGADEWSPGG